MESSAEGMRTLWISLAVLGSPRPCRRWSWLCPARSRCSATLHNVADALTAVPLGVAFVARAPRGDPPVHLRLRPGRGPGRHRHRRWPSPPPAALAALRRRDRPAAAPARGRPSARGRRGGGDRLRRQRVGGPLPDPHRAPDRLGRAGRRRAARPYRRLHLAGRAARRGRRRAGLAAGRPGRRPADHGRDPARPQGRGPRGLPPADGRRRPGAGRRAPRRPCARSRAWRRSASCGLRWIGHTLRAEATSWSTATSACRARPTPSPSRPSTRCCTPSRG